MKWIFDKFCRIYSNTREHKSIENYIQSPGKSYLAITTGWLFLMSLFLLSCNERTRYREKNGFVMVEAEHFNSQSAADVRKWHIVDNQFSGDYQGFLDNYATSASGGKYLMLLPDTRVTHADKLIKGENFSNEPGKLAILDYPVYFENPGKYYVWVNAYSTGTEDNGVHVGLNGQWPESGARMQWCQGKNQWTWDSKQRTDEQHCGVERQIYLEIPNKGLHTISFSMREDGFRFDRFALSKKYIQPE